MPSSDRQVGAGAARHSLAADGDPARLHQQTTPTASLTAAMDAMFPVQDVLVAALDVNIMIHSRWRRGRGSQRCLLADFDVLIGWSPPSRRCCLVNPRPFAWKAFQ